LESCDTFDVSVDQCLQVLLQVKRTVEYRQC
jgi:hypothetical protein